MKKMIWMAAAMAGAVMALGQWEPPGGAEDPASAMYTMEAVHQRLASGTNSARRAGGFVEPASGPAGGPAAINLNDLMQAAPVTNSNPALPEHVLSGRVYWGLSQGSWGARTGTFSCGTSAGVPKTGQTTAFGTGDDGWWSTNVGVAWPDPRFTVTTNVIGGTNQIVATDNLTELMWVQAPHDLEGNDSFATWAYAVSFCHNLEFAGYTDWRLPNVQELQSMFNYGADNMATWLDGHGFTNILANAYWSSTTDAMVTNRAIYVDMTDGTVSRNVKSWAYPVWPVRGGL